MSSDQHQSTRTVWEFHETDSKKAYIEHPDGHDSIFVTHQEDGEKTSIEVPIESVPALKEAFGSAYLDIGEVSWERWDEKHREYEVDNVNVKLISPADEASFKIMSEGGGNPVEIPFARIELGLYKNTIGRLVDDLFDPEPQPDPDYEIYYREEWEDHLVADGELVCDHFYDIRPPKPSQLKPIEEITDREEWLMTNKPSLCSQCYEYAIEHELISKPDISPPQFRCPDCGNNVESVLPPKFGLRAIAVHADGSRHLFSHTKFERWRRGEDISDVYDE